MPSLTIYIDAPDTFSAGSTCEDSTASGWFKSPGRIAPFHAEILPPLSAEEFVEVVISSGVSPKQLIVDEPHDGITVFVRAAGEMIPALFEAARCGKRIAISAWIEIGPGVSLNPVSDLIWHRSESKILHITRTTISIEAYRDVEHDMMQHAELRQPPAVEPASKLDKRLTWITYLLLVTIALQVWHR